MKCIKKILLSLVAVFGVLSFTAACDKNNNENKESSTESTVPFIDYVAQTKLNQVCTKDSSFFGNDGIAFATLVRNVDGDTTVFMVEGKEMTARYAGVDTPESTGSIEKWGKTASYFTAGKLNTAKSIIVQTDGGPATTDSNGTRYMTYVWYQPSDGGDYRLLNLELVQEGLSYGKSATAPRYSDVLIQAQAQSLRLKIRLYGPDNFDENWYGGEVIETTIKGILDNQEQYVKDTVKVRFDCTVTRNDGMYVYAQDVDGLTGEVYSILLYKGYNLTTKKLENGNRVTICGNVAEYEGNVQITSMQDIPLSTSADNIKLISKGNEVVCKEVNPSELVVSNTGLSRCLVRMNNIKVISTYTTKNGGSNDGAVTITGICDGKNVTIRTSVLIDDNYQTITEDVYKNQTIDVTGIVEEYNGAYQIKVVAISDVIFHNN